MSKSILGVHSDKSWGDSFKAFLHPRVITMLFLGFSAGLPIFLVFGTLSAWFTDAGVAKSTIGFFAWAGLGYSFKFVWAPLVDALPVPVLSQLMGRRRSWLLISQTALAAAIVLSGLTDPNSENGLVLFAAFTVFLGFSSATQDIIIDAYRIDSAPDDLQAMMAASYIGGYRIGMLVAGAGALTMAELLGSRNESYMYSAWMWTYFALASFMVIGIITTFIIKEPESKNNTLGLFKGKSDYARFLAAFLLLVAAFIAAFLVSGDSISMVKRLLIEDLGLAKTLSGFLAGTLQMVISALCAFLTGFVIWKLNFAPRDIIKASYVDPFADFFKRFGKVALLILVLISFYKIADIVLGIMAIPFYLELGFTKIDIATISKGYGLAMTLIGGFLGGLLCVRYGVLKILFLGALLTAATNLLFALLAQTGKDMNLLTAVITADNLSAGIAGAAFVGYLSSLTNRAFSATQYALFSSIMILFPKVIAGYSGVWAETFGWETFFVITALMGIPVMILIVLVARVMTPEMMGIVKQK